LHRADIETWPVWPEFGTIKISTYNLIPGPQALLSMPNGFFRFFPWPQERVPETGHIIRYLDARNTVSLDAFLAMHDLADVHILFDVWRKRATDQNSLATLIQWLILLRDGIASIATYSMTHRQEANEDTILVFPKCSWKKQKILLELCVPFSAQLRSVSGTRNHACVSWTRFSGFGPLPGQRQLENAIYQSLRQIRWN
jgi:hypothetical protein